MLWLRLLGVLDPEKVLSWLLGDTSRVFIGETLPVGHL